MDGLRNGQRLGIGLPKNGCPPLGIGVPQSIGCPPLGIGVPQSIGSPMAPGVPPGDDVQVQILQGFGFLGGLGSNGSREQGLFLVHFGVETPGLFRFASTGAVPVMQTKESIRGKTSSFFMIIIISYALLCITPA